MHTPAEMWQARYSESETYLCGMEPNDFLVEAVERIPPGREIDFTGQEVRFDVETSTGGNVGAVEVRVFAPAS